MRRARQIWIELIRQCEKSGLSAEEFAERREIPVHTLRRWMWQLRRENEGEAPVLPVRVIASTAPTRRGSDEVVAIEVELTDGVRLRFAGTPVEVVVEVVGRLRRC